MPDTESSGRLNAYNEKLFKLKTDDNNTDEIVSTPEEDVSHMAYITLGQRLESLRKNAGMTSNEVAKFLGVSRQAVNMYENDTRTPALETLIDYSSLFQISLSAMFDHVIIKRDNRRKSGRRKKSSDKKEEKE